MSRWPAAFARFCYEFVVGDTPELAVGVALIMVCVWALVRAGGATSFWVIPLAVTALLALSLWRRASSA